MCEAEVHVIMVTKPARMGIRHVLCTCHNIFMLVLMGGMLVIIIAVVVVSAVTSVVSAVAASEDIDS